MRVSATVSIADMSKAVRRAGATEVERRANRYGGMMVDAVVKNIEGLYHTDRPDSRRRDPGSQHVNEGWDYKVEGDPGSFPILLTLTAEGDGAYLKRVHYLNDGTGGHGISARKRGGKRGYLQIPRTGDGATPGPPWRYPKKVMHPGHAGDRFIERAAEVVVGRIGRRFI